MIDVAIIIGTASSGSSTAATTAVIGEPQSPTPYPRDQDTSTLIGVHELSSKIIRNVRNSARACALSAA
jgi:hypothetical protein